jgi:hypothetical protein
MEDFLQQLEIARKLYQSHEELEAQSSQLLSGLLEKYVDPVARTFGYRGIDLGQGDAEPLWGTRAYKKGRFEFTVTLGLNPAVFAEVDFKISDKVVEFEDDYGIKLNPRRMCDADYLAKVVEYCDSVMTHVKVAETPFAVKPVVDEHPIVRKFPIQATKEFEK